MSKHIIEAMKEKIKKKRDHVELGVRAWRNGWSVSIFIFCANKQWHELTDTDWIRTFYRSKFNVSQWWWWPWRWRRRQKICFSTPSSSSIHMRLLFMTVGQQWMCSAPFSCYFCPSTRLEIWFFHRISPHTTDQVGYLCFHCTIHWFCLAKTKHTYIFVDFSTHRLFRCYRDRLAIELPLRNRLISPALNYLWSPIMHMLAEYLGVKYHFRDSSATLREFVACNGCLREWEEKYKRIMVNGIR